VIRSARRAVRVTAFALAAGGILPVHAVHERFVSLDEKDKLEERYKRTWCSAMLRLFGIRVRVIGTPPVTDSGMVIVANHRSAIDIALMFRVFGGHMLSRADISGWPLFGALARKIGTVFVDRQDAASGATAIRIIRQLLKDGQTVNIFPEGTTFDGDLVRPFHLGAFVAALRTGAEILPVGMAYTRGSGAAFVNETFLQHLSRLAASPPSRVAVCIGAPLQISGRARAHELRDTAHSAVQELVHEARVRCDGPGGA